MTGYDLGPFLGSGGFAVVHEARAGDRQVALKIGTRTDPTALERFRREVAALQDIGPPVVPELVDSGVTEDGRPFIAMERLSGPSLADYLAGRERPPDLEELARVADAILAAVEAVHARGYVHRDLKPENIFLATSGGAARLIDFGLVHRPQNQALTRSGVAIGTVEYMAPEQLCEAQEVGSHTDIYAVGVLLYELVTMRPPFVGPPARIEHGHVVLRPPRPGQFARMPSELEEVVLRCLSKDPARRPDATELRSTVARTLARAETAESDTTETESPTRTAIRSHGRQPVVLLLAESTGAVERLIEAGDAHGGLLARHRQNSLIFAFPGTGRDDPVPAALAAAQRMVAGGARVALHLAGLLVRRSSAGGRPSVYGAEVDRPEDWAPRGPWSGILLTRAVARLLPPQGGSVAADHPDFQRPTDSPLMLAFRDWAMVGREQLVGALLDSAARATGDRVTTLVTVVGEEGMGKTRLADEVRRQLEQVAPESRVLSVSARRPGAGDSERVLRTLLRMVLGTLDKSPPDDPRALCQELLGDRLGAEVWQGVAVQLGWVPAQAVGVLPGRLRQDAVRAIGQGLQRLAAHGPIVVLLDDGQWADDLTLDALEHATREGAFPLWICILATPRLAQTRPALGSRADRYLRFELPPLDEAASARLARALMPRVEHTPPAVLSRLVSAAGGNPSTMVDVIADLERERVIRPYAGSDSWYIASDELERLPSSPTRQWLAARALEAMPPELSELTRICSVIGAEFSLDEIEYVQREIERQAPASVLADAPTGIARLVQQRLLAPTDGQRYSFRETAFQEACYELVSNAARRGIHEHAYNYWRGLPGSVGVDRLYRVAYHGARSGYTDDARICYLALAAAAEARHSYAEAEAMYTSALATSSGDELRSRILARRGQVRRRMTHFEDALSDFGEAASLAERRGDAKALKDALVAQSAIHDFTQRYTEAAELIERARQIPSHGQDPVSEARMLNWLGVSHHRAHRDEKAVPILSMAIALAESIGDHETQVGSMLALGLALVRLGDTAGALRAFNDVIGLCERVGDSFHQACAFSNRVEVWREQRNSDRASQDLQEVIRIAREYDYAVIEAAGYANLAEHLFWSGDVGGAVDAARRGHAHSQKRFRDNPLLATTLYYGQLLAHVGDHDAVRAILEQVEGIDLADPMLALSRDAMRASIDAAPTATWADILKRARAEDVGLQVVELQWLWGRCELRAGRPAQAKTVLEDALAKASTLGAGLCSLIRQDVERASDPAMVR